MGFMVWMLIACVFVLFLRLFLLRKDVKRIRKELDSVADFTDIKKIREIQKELKTHDKKLKDLDKDVAHLDVNYEKLKKRK